MKTARGPLVIAHRGESRDAPENTRGAITLAWERGARAVEIDVRLSADGAIVVIHDPDLRRVAGARVSVAASTCEQMRRFDVGAWKHRRWSGERLPLLRDVLESVPRSGRLFIEIKVGPEIVPELRRVLRDQNPEATRPILISFRRDTLAALHAARTGCETGLLLTANQWLRGRGIVDAIAAARALGCAALDVQVHRRLDRAVIAAVHAAGMPLYVWTVNRLSTARRLAVAGIDGITTDRCAWMSAHLLAEAAARAREGR